MTTCILYHYCSLCKNYHFYCSCGPRADLVFSCLYPLSGLVSSCWFCILLLVSCPPAGLVSSCWSRVLLPVSCLPAGLVSSHWSGILLLVSCPPAGLVLLLVSFCLSHVLLLVLYPSPVVLLVSCWSPAGVLQSPTHWWPQGVLKLAGLLLVSSY